MFFTVTALYRIDRAIEPHPQLILSGRKLECCRGGVIATLERLARVMQSSWHSARRNVSFDS
jgi:hypothetical protein